MSILTDAIIDEAKQNAAPEDINAAPEFTGTEQTQTNNFSFPDFSFLHTPTGEGSIEDYIHHPLNTNGSRGMAQILRGCTGIAGDLKLAIIDILLGSLNLIKEKNINA